MTERRFYRFFFLNLIFLYFFHMHKITIKKIESDLSKVPSRWNILSKNGWHEKFGACLVIQFLCLGIQKNYIIVKLLALFKIWKKYISITVYCDVVEKRSRSFTIRILFIAMYIKVVICPFTNRDEKHIPAQINSPKRLFFFFICFISKRECIYCSFLL